MQMKHPARLKQTGDIQLCPQNPTTFRTAINTNSLLVVKVKCEVYYVISVLIGGEEGRLDR